MLKHSNKFKNEVFEAFKQDAVLLTRIVDAIENQRDNKLRIALEEGLEDPKLYVTKIRNKKSQKHINPYFKGTYIKRQKIYSSFMERYLETIDSTKMYARDS